MHSDAINQLLLAGSNSCCDRASALVVGKLNPHNAVAKISIRIAGSDLWFTDMVVTLAAVPDLGKGKTRNGSLGLKLPGDKNWQFLFDRTCIQEFALYDTQSPFPVSGNRAPGRCPPQ